MRNRSQRLFANHHGYQNPAARQNGFAASARRMAQANAMSSVPMAKLGAGSALFTVLGVMSALQNK